MSGYDKRLIAFQDRIGYKFQNPDLLTRALTHSSYGDGRRQHPDNERLEFLGDRVLGLLTADRLFHESGDKEGLMARRLNALVRKETCADIARALDFGEVMRISKSEQKQNGRDKTSILGDACEAVLAAIYLDGGLAPVQAFFNSHWAAHVEAVLAASAKDPKTELQERAVARGFPQPVYSVISRSGPDHRPEFVIQVTITGLGEAEGQGSAKKEAERQAAAAMLAHMERARD